MAHHQQQNFILTSLRRHQNYVDKAINVLEIGSQDISGSVRSFFGPSQAYIGIDLGKARGVDLVVPGELLQLSTGWADISISTECFEHASGWKDIMLNMIRITKENGLILITCAGFGRPTHGTIDTNIYSSPFTESYYKNLIPEDIDSAINSGKYFKKYGFEVDCVAKDTYFWGIRNACVDAETMITEEALARARGQISMISTELAHLKYELMSLQEPLIRKILRKSLNQVKKITHGQQ